MRTTDIQTLATTLAAKRQSAEMSASELARRAGVTASTITRLEAAQIVQPGADTLLAIARVLGISVSDLFISADWLPRGDLPTFTPYLRSKYRDLPAAAQREIEASFAEIAQKYGYDSNGPADGEDE